MMAPGIEAQQTTFTLAVGQSVTMGDYALQFKGFADRWPRYDLYYLGRLLASLPPLPLAATWNEYTHGNVSIVTTAVAADGTVVTGTLAIK